MRFTIVLLLVVGLFACQPTEPATSNVTSEQLFQLDLSENPLWEKDDFRLIPITASATFITEQERLAQYKVLGEALEDERFRITEKKPYGRFSDAQAVSTLTVQNKSQDTVFLMAGEVVQGGNQDRVLAENSIVPPRTITDIPVFCVEQGRWTYEGDHALNEADKKIFAFRGYYNVAPSAIRRSVHAGSQQAVWDEVAVIRSEHDVNSDTQAFADLEENAAFVDQRNRLQLYFSDKLANNEEIVGFVALDGGRILGADLFGHPALLNRQFDAVLAGYITDAISSDAEVELHLPTLQQFAEQFMAESESEGYVHEGMVVHHSKLP